MQKACERYRKNVLSDTRGADVLHETRVQVGGLNSACDEDDAGALIGVRPAFELHGRMKHVMDAMDGDRPVLADQIENAFDAQQILTRPFLQPRQPG